MINPTAIIVLVVVRLLQPPISLIPARAGLFAVADPRGRNTQAGTAIYHHNTMFKFVLCSIVAASGLFAAACSEAKPVAENPDNGMSNSTVIVETQPVNQNSETVQPGVPATNQTHATTITRTVITASPTQTPEAPVPVQPTKPEVVTAVQEVKQPAEEPKPAKAASAPTPQGPSPEEIRRMMNFPPKKDEISSTPMKANSAPVMMKKKP